MIDLKLWFDVEQEYKTTTAVKSHFCAKLWFDVEQEYKTTTLQSLMALSGCGLM